MAFVENQGTTGAPVADKQGQAIEVPNNLIRMRTTGSLREVLAGSVASVAEKGTTGVHVLTCSSAPHLSPMSAMSSMC